MRKQELLEHIESVNEAMSKAKEISRPHEHIMHLEKYLNMLRRELAHIESGSSDEFVLTESEQKQQDLMAEYSASQLKELMAEIIDSAQQEFGPDEQKVVSKVASFFKELLGPRVGVEVVKLESSGAAVH